MANNIRDVPLLGAQVMQMRKQTKKGKDISVYPEITEKSIIPEDECCKKVCTAINDIIDNTQKGVRMCENLRDYGLKGACYNRWKYDTDALLRIRKSLAEQEICKCYE